ncbi:MAG: NAD(P)-dependent alcohol dehydrogenase [Acidimicrobiia bacterium]
MKAITQDRYGSTDVLETEEIDQPAIGEDGILLEVQAASVNPLDWHFMRGKPFLVRLTMGLRAPMQRVRGVDVAGTVAAVGEDVTEFQPGDEVYGWCQGAFAEYAASRQGALLPRPGSLSAEQAAAVPVAGFTALQGLRDLGKIEAGHRVLVIGASGGVGTFAVQIAKAMGASVTGVCSTRNVDLVRSLGADNVIDYSQEDVTSGDDRYDIIFQLAGTASPGRLRRILSPKGTLVLSSGMGRLGGIDRMVKALVTSPFVSQRLVTWIAKNDRDDLLALSELIEAGKLSPVIDRSFDLAETAEAIRFVEEGHTRGKVIVTP